MSKAPQHEIALLAFAAAPFLGPCDTEVLGIRAAPPILQV